jgi:glycine/D-amino acid oxidase-like deaminating enzyme
MSEQDTIAVIGAGVIGAAVAFALARDGRRVVLLDRAEPGVAGASFGNVGHIAAELVQPLPSPGLLFGFWRELIGFGGALNLPARQVLRMLPWIRMFAAAAFRRAENTRQLARLGGLTCCAGMGTTKLNSVRAAMHACACTPA